MQAARRNNIEALKILVDHGCDLGLQLPENPTDGDAGKQTPLDIAIAHQKHESVLFLLEAMGQGAYHRKNSVALQIALANSDKEVKGAVSGASLMYPYIGSKVENSGQFAWLD